jgi:hypothetical protein
MVNGVLAEWNPEPVRLEPACLILLAFVFVATLVVRADGCF